MKWGLNLSWVPGSSIQLNSSSDCEELKKSVSSFTGSPIHRLSQSKGTEQQNAQQTHGTVFQN